MRNYEIVSELTVWQFTRLCTALYRMGKTLTLWYYESDRYSPVWFDGRYFMVGQPMINAREFFYDIEPSETIVFSSQMRNGVVFVGITSDDRSIIPDLMKLAGA